MLYLAYGSNLHRGQMAMRCPAAVPVKSFVVTGWRLVFRGVADIEEGRRHDRLPVGVYEITEKCERALDRYEGYPRLYGKWTAKIPGVGRVMYYKMNQGGTSPPSDGYFQTILEGYGNWKLDPEPLYAALDRAWQDRLAVPA